MKTTRVVSAPKPLQGAYATYDDELLSFWVPPGLREPGSMRPTGR